MNKIEALTQIFELVRSAHTRKVSELTDLEKHAVAFCCSYFPAKLQNGKLKYDKSAKETDLSVEFVLMNSFATKLGMQFKKFVAASVHVWPDEPLPRYVIMPINAALDNYPNDLMIPARKNEDYIHLPTIQPPVTKTSVDELHSVVATELAALQVYASNPDLTILRKHYIIAREIKKHIDSARAMEDKWNLRFVTWVTTLDIPNYKLTYLEQYDRAKYNASYLAAFIYAQAKGIYISD